MFSLALALALALAAPQAKPVVAAKTSPTTSAPLATLQLLESPAQVHALCEALRPSERMREKGDVVARARAEADHDARRDVALNGRYRIRISADQLRFADYDPGEEQLALSRRAVLAAAGGTLQVWPVEDGGLPMTVDVAAAQRIMQAAARKTLALTITFTLPDEDDGVACVHPNGSHRYALGIEPLGWEYVDGEQVLARGGEGADRPIVTAAQGALPRIRLSDPFGGGGRELKSAVEAREKDLEGCYQRALQHNPGLDGSLVAEVDLGDGTRSVRIAADSVQDEAMTACVTGVISTVEFPRGEDVRADLPIHFVLEPPPAESGSGAPLL